MNFSWVRFRKSDKPYHVDVSVRYWHPGWWMFLYKQCRQGLTLDLRFRRWTWSVPSWLLALIAVPYVVVSTSRGKR